jgi:TolB-like protein/class 3 adenylate cyclase/Tfp pilus assembly protein PilF
MASTRRLAAILAADVAGYSRLMGADEEGTHERLKAHLVELVDPKIHEHHGRIVKKTGDGMLAEFASVVDALRCATEVQAGMTERNAAAPADQRIEFRIGIHQGDVVVEDHDIFGDAVNVAARLEALAEPGGICVSARVRGDAAGKLELAFEDMGQQELKNIARPIRVYAVRLRAVANPLAPDLPAAPPVPQPAVAPRLSIVVLPFANLGNDPEQQYFADGITEDLTTDLSRLAHMLVISRNTAFTYQGKRVDTKQIGRELCVRYVLEGSIRRSGTRIRVNAQLIDAATDAHLWAERFDGDTSDLFALQDEITSRIAVALNLELIQVEADRPTEHPDALDYIFRARAVGLKPPSRESRSEQISLYERALALDPQSIEAQSRLASELAARVLDNMTDMAAADISRAERLAGQALAVSPRNPLAHHAKGQVLRAQGRLREAIPEYETALASDRNLVSAHNALGYCKFYSESMDEVIPLVEQAIRLSPRDPAIGFCYFRIGQVHMVQSRIDEAIVWFEKARSAIPRHPQFHAYLASVYALKGEVERPAFELAEARKLSGDDRYLSITRLKSAGVYSGVPEALTLLERTYFAGLRKLGMPET